ncbi:MAG: hypothetical protein RI572_01385 [Salegentibacter sp.]|uniref:hypothetical protein n=1 Tax=Salegentibacter sp. TaxID=1903072 RepID=UPI0028704E1A|nr:hypothetical protein [Salegentibacter sp.]MDR9456036.1 hypothetical protein [Salegentibacter sp.]
MKNLFFMLIAGVASLFFFSCETDAVGEDGIEKVSDLSATKKMDPAVIPIKEENLFPEGIEYDQREDRFLVSSITRGTIGQVKDGIYSEFITDPDLIASIGIHIDNSRKRLLVINSHIDGSFSALAAYELSSGERLFYTDLLGLKDGPSFTNDVTVDKNGIAYVTDSYAGIIYKVDEEGNPSVFYEDEELAPSPGNAGLNGIDYDPRGYLLVSHLETNRILRIPINTPEAYSKVDIPVDMFGPDGIYLKNPNELLVVSNDGGGENAVVHTFKTKDKWKSAILKDAFPTYATFPTTVTVKKNTPYVLYSYLPILLSGGSQDEFQIVKAE